MKTSQLSSLARKRILLVEDHPLYREGLRKFIEHEPDLVVCDEADSVETGFAAARQLKPDLVILDLRLHQEDGLELLNKLALLEPPPRVLVLSQKDELVFAEPALRSGAQGFLMKEEATEQILTAMRAVLRGEIYLSRRLAAMTLKRFFQGGPGDEVAGKLTVRELQVFQLLGSGFGTRQIAEQLHLSVKTIDTHRENIKQKLGFKDAATLVHAAQTWARQ